MQFSYALLALFSTLAFANPIAEPVAEAVAEPIAEPENMLMRRGIDLCPPDTKRVGQGCSFGSGDDSPHACSATEGSAILVCRNGKWAVERRCGGGKTCGCTSQKDIICRL